MLARLCCLLALVALTWGQSPAPPDYGALQAELDSNRATWDSSTGCCYTMTIRRSCFCVVESLGPFTAVVENDQIVSVEPQEFSDDLPTVNGVFDLIQDAIDNRAARVTVSYDASLGYPTNVFIDTDFRIADEEIGYELSVTLDQEPSPSPSVFPSPRPGRCRVRLGDFGISQLMGSPGNGFSRTAFIRNLIRWGAYLRSVGCSYKYKFTRSCFCLTDFVGPFIITVENDAVVSAEFEDPTQGNIPANILAELPTITELFQIIYDEAVSADSVTIVYDSSTGVPTSASIDRIAGAIDDEITYLAELL